MGRCSRGRGHGSTSMAGAEVARAKARKQLSNEPFTDDTSTSDTVKSRNSGPKGSRASRKAQVGTATRSLYPTRRVRTSALMTTPSTEAPPQASRLYACVIAYAPDRSHVL